MALRKLSPGGYEYLTGAVACADRELEPGESLADYYFAHGYPPGEWFGRGAQALGVSGQATQAQMTALFGEGRHPNADTIEAAALIDDGASADEALAATQLGRRFPRYGGLDDLRSEVIAAYKSHNQQHGRLVGEPIHEATRAQIRTQVITRAFAQAHDGQPPRGDRELSIWLAEQNAQLKTAVAGFEMVFAPPKSVSAAWALTDDTTRELITNLHRQAVRDALTYFEANAAFTRQGNWGEAQVDVDGITAVLFEHWDSRTGDPHLHTHVPISTKVRRGTDGKWTSLDSRTVFAATVTVSEYYNSRLRDLLTEHGASWTQRPAAGVDAKRPVWELDGVPQALIEGFSRRAQQVEADRAQRIVDFRLRRGREPNAKELLELSKQAQYATRVGKQQPRTLAEHVAVWRDQGHTLVGDKVLGNLAARVFEARTEMSSEIDVAALGRSTLQEVEAHHTHFNRWNIEAEAHRQTAGLRLAPDKRDRLIADVVHAALTTEGCLSLQPPPLVDEPAMLRRRNGESVFTQHNAARYTTTRTLRCEHDLLTHARRRGGHWVSDYDLRRALRGEWLNAGQQDMVRSFAQSKRRLQLALAPAGAGKTTAMRVLANAWRNSGGRVFAFAPSARAAQELGDTIGAEPHTLHQLTTAHAAGDAARVFSFRRGDLVVIDEAAMAGTHTLHQVVTYALDCGADVRLVGDDHQLGAVEAGGAVKLIASDVGADRLHEIVRFTDAAEAHASLQIRQGDPHGLDHYLDQGRVRSGSRETMRDAAHRRWRADLDDGKHSLLIVPTHDDVVALNLQARAQHIRRGRVDDCTSIALADGTRASTGDHIVSRRNQRRLTVGRDDFVKNGDTWRVRAVHADGSLTADGHPGRVVLPASYVAAHVELAYAATVHRVQGMTSDTAHVLVPDALSREQLYTGITRGRHSNHLYVVTHHHVADQHQETPPDRTAHDVLIGVLDRSGIETSATEMLRHTLRDTDSLATLVLRYNHAARYGDTDRYLDTLRQHVPAVLHQPAEPALIQTLRNAFDLGWQPDQLLTNPYLVDGLHEGRDPAALLSWRIDQHITHHTPPPPVVEPNPTDITRWRRRMTTSVPHKDTRGDEWNAVWRAAARGKHDGLNPDAAIIDAAGRLAARTENYHLPDHRYTAAVVAAALADQRDRGHGYQPALPWLARIDFTTIDQHEGLRDYLRELNTTIATRAAELRGTTARQQPDWTERLGARPTNTDLASQWDRLAGLASAYRETHLITDTDPSSPLGKKPDSASLRTRAWKQLTNEWRPTVTTPNDPAGHRAANQRTINALREQMAELREDNRDFALDRQDERRREDEVHRRSASDSRGAYESVESDGGESRTSGLGY